MLIHVQFKVNLFEMIREIYFPARGGSMFVGVLKRQGPVV